MRLVDRAIFVGILAVLLGACQKQPPDLRMKTLDPKGAVQEADTIVLAYPVSQRDIRGLLVPSPDRPPLKLEETETTLQTLQVLRGAALPAQIRFRYYDARGYAQIGPPQGPSGGVGSRGIFFLLKGQSEGIYRSVVDVYRPVLPRRGSSVCQIRSHAPRLLRIVLQSSC
jgi:hypothetical protein